MLGNAFVETVLEGMAANPILIAKQPVLATAAKSVVAHGEMLYMELAFIKNNEVLQQFT